VETLKVVRNTFTMLSEKRTQVLDITKQIRDIVLGADIKEGIILVNSLHTTCALFVNEFQGALVEDLKAMMDRLVADDAGYKHDDPRYSDCERGNATSHLRAALLGRSVAVGISGGELSLGRFQSILFAELDGPDALERALGAEKSAAVVAKLRACTESVHRSIENRHDDLYLDPGEAQALFVSRYRASFST